MADGDKTEMVFAAPVPPPEHGLGDDTSIYLQELDTADRLLSQLGYRRTVPGPLSGLKTTTRSRTGRAAIRAMPSGGRYAGMSALRQPASSAAPRPAASAITTATVAPAKSAARPARPRRRTRGRPFT